MAVVETNQPPQSNSNDVGVFIDNKPYGYVSASPATIKRVLSHFKDAMRVAPNKQTLQDLLTIKMLAPEESKELKIYNISQAIAYISDIREALVTNYTSMRMP